MEKDQLIHPWVCRRNESNQIQLTFIDVNHNTTIIGITKRQIDSLREELKAFMFSDEEDYYSCPKCGSTDITGAGCEEVYICKTCNHGWPADPVALNQSSATDKKLSIFSEEVSDFKETFDIKEEK